MAYYNRPSILGTITDIDGDIMDVGEIWIVVVYTLCAAMAITIATASLLFGILSFIVFGAIFFSIMRL